jgi:hypothetical protein
MSGTNCTFEHKFTNEGYPEYLYKILPFKTYTSVPRKTYVFEKEENFEQLQMFVFLEGFRSYFQRIVQHIEVPAYNSFTIAREADQEERGDGSFDDYARSILQRYHWLYANIEESLGSSNGVTYDFNSLMGGVYMFAYRNDEISGNRVIQIGNGVMASHMLADYSVVNGEISPAELKIGLDEMKSIAQNIVMYCNRSEDEWFKLWGVSRGDQNEGQEEILERRKTALLFLEANGLLSKYTSNGRTYLSKFRSPREFWKPSEDWKPKARRQLTDQIVQDLARITGLIHEQDIYIVELSEMMGRRRAI